MNLTWTSNDSVSTISGGKVYATAQVGENGVPGGTPEYFVGTSSSNISGRKEWDPDASSSLASHWVAMSLECNPGGGTNGVKLTLAGGDPSPLIFSSASYGTIQQLKIRAAVTTGGARIAWRNLTIAFYKNGSLVESQNVETGPVADKYDVMDMVEYEQILTATPASNDNTKVVISGEIRLMSVINTPDPYSIFGDFVVFAN